MEVAMKKLSVFVLSIVLLAACAPTAQGLAQLPDEGRLLVLMLVTAGVTWVLLKLSMAFHIDLSGYTNAIAAVLAPIVVVAIETYLRLIPSVFDNLVLSIIHLLVLLVGSVGTFFLFKRKAPSLL
jgi:hypothetical protein